MTKRQRFTKQFKLEALKLLKSGEQSGAEIARQLGIRRNILYKWQQELTDKADAAFQGPGCNAIMYRAECLTQWVLCMACSQAMLSTTNE